MPRQLGLEHIFWGGHSSTHYTVPWTCNYFICHELVNTLFDNSEKHLTQYIAHGSYSINTTSFPPDNMTA